MSTQRKLYYAHGRSQDIYAWSAELGVPKQTLYNRIAAGHSHEDALVKTVGDGKRLRTDEAWLGAHETPWSEDVWARRMVADLGPMTWMQVGACIGLTREGARQIALSGLRKLGLSEDAPDLRELLAERMAARDERDETWPEDYAVSGE